MTGAAVGVDGGTGDSGARRAGADPLGAAAFALLVVACFAAFFITQRLKHTPTVVQRFELTPRFSPTSSGHIKLERISFKLAHADVVTVAIVDNRGDVVATLINGQPVARYKQLSLRWNGRTGTAAGVRELRSSDGHVSLLADTGGPLAPAGEYRVRVSLRRQTRPLLLPRSFTLVRSGSGP